MYVKINYMYVVIVKSLPKLQYIESWNLIKYRIEKEKNNYRRWSTMYICLEAHIYYKLMSNSTTAIIMIISQVLYRIITSVNLFLGGSFSKINFIIDRVHPLCGLMYENIKNTEMNLIKIVVCICICQYCTIWYLLFGYTVGYVNCQFTSHLSLALHQM